MNLTVAFWNRWRLGNAERQSEYLANGQVEWDVLLLAEMTPRAFEALCQRLEPTSAVFALDIVNVNDMKQPHGVAIITRHGRSLSNVRLLPADDSDPETAPRPERFIAADVDGVPVPLTVAAWHAPYAAGRSKAQRLANRRRKQRGYQQVNAWLTEQAQSLVVGMDGNNWHDRLEDAEPELLGNEWDDERRFHASGPEHGLVDTLRVAIREDASTRAAYRAGEPLAVTHRIPSAGHRMDRIYASPVLEVVDAGVDYDGRAFNDIENLKQLTAGSDHALVWVTVHIA